MIARWGNIGTYNAIAAGAITPGDLIEVIATAGATNGQVQAHATAGGRAAPLFANFNSPYGGGKGDAYAANDSVIVLVPSPGALIMARCATGVLITKGTVLESAGGGLLKALGTGVPIAEAMEAENTTGEPTPGRLLVRILAQ
jgi:hypothetical protein